jgi:hypothetical protein
MKKSKDLIYHFLRSLASICHREICTSCFYFLITYLYVGMITGQLGFHINPSPKLNLLGEGCVHPLLTNGLGETACAQLLGGQTDLRLGLLGLDGPVYYWFSDFYCFFLSDQTTQTNSNLNVYTTCQI